MKHLLIGFIRAWRFAISPLYGQVCRYHPTCSAYALEAVTEHGAVRGTWLAVRRIGRCHPWAAGGYGTLLNWDGNVWTPRPITNVYDDFTHIWGSGPNDIWLLSDGRLRHYTGTTWPITPYPPTRLVRSMHGSSAEEVWLGGSNGATPTAMTTTA